MAMYFRQIVKKVCQREGLKKFQTLQGVYLYRLQQLEELPPENTVDVLTNGVSGIAVMSGIVSSSNPYSKSEIL